MWITIAIIITIFCILLIIYRGNKNKISFVKIKINIIENKIADVLNKRLELLKDSEKIIKDVTKTKKEIYQEINNLDNYKNLIELDKQLSVLVNEFYLINDKYENLQNNEEFQKIEFAISETEDLLISYKKYFNDKASKYNKLIAKFPNIIVEKIEGHKVKNFFEEDDDNQNEYEYLN